MRAEGHQENVCKQNAVRASGAYMGKPFAQASRSAISGHKAIWVGRISGKKGDDARKKNSPTNHSSMR